MRKIVISVSIISTSLTVRTQPSPRFHVKAWLPFRNCEMDYWPEKPNRDGTLKMYLCM